MMSFSFANCHIDCVRPDSSKKICKISQIIRILVCMQEPYELLHIGKFCVLYNAKIHCWYQPSL